MRRTKGLKKTSSNVKCSILWPKMGPSRKNLILSHFYFMFQNPKMLREYKKWRCLVGRVFLFLAEFLYFKKIKILYFLCGFGFWTIR